jgi:hypothetical protein
MALDRKYQALPEPCQLLHELGERIQFLNSYLCDEERLSSGHPSGRNLHTERTLKRMIQDVKLRHPGIEKRHYDVERRQDSLLYLLSEGRRQGRGGMTYANENDMGSKIMNGASALPKHLQTDQGFPMRYSPAIEVQQMASYLEGMTTDDLRRVYHPVHMEERGVYKFFADRAEWEWEYISHTFEGLKAFYIEVAAHQEGILVVTY